MRFAQKRPAHTLCATLLALVPLAAFGQDGPCRQALALGLDVSGSVDGAEYRLQLDGLAGALSHPDVTRALLATAGAPVHITVYEWSGPSAQSVIVDWTAITDAGTLADVIARLGANTRRPADPSTALGTALVVGGGMLAERAGCWQRTLDISGDGISNTGPRPQDVDSRPELEGITVNALVIAPDAIAPPGGPKGLLGYFETYVIRGPGAFAEHAQDFAAYEAAMVRKLLKELQGLVVGGAGRPETDAPAPAKGMSAHGMSAHGMPSHGMPAHGMPAHGMPAHGMDVLANAAELTGHRVRGRYIGPINSAR